MLECFFFAGMFWVKVDETMLAVDQVKAMRESVVGEEVLTNLDMGDTKEVYTIKMSAKDFVGKTNQCLEEAVLSEEELGLLPTE